MSSPTISIIVPVYNVKEYLPRCLDSLISQTLKDIEIIAIDDGSTDGSSSVLDSYSIKDERIKVIHVENGGVARARNIGLDNAKGEYIGFVDSDDFVDSQMYEKLLKVALETKSDFVQCLFDVVDDNSPVITPTSKREVTVIDNQNEIVGLFFDCKIDASVCNKLYSRLVLSQIRFPIDWAFAEDFSLNIKSLFECRRIALINDVLYHYYVRSASASRENISDRHLKGFSMYDFAKEHLEDENVVRIVSEKEVSESLRFLDSSIGHKEVSDGNIEDLIRRIKTGRRWIKGNRYMTRGRRLRARFVCLSPKLYIFVVKVGKKLR